MDWKNIIKQVLARNNLTQTEAALMVGCSQSCIADLVSGRTHEPRYSLGFRLLELLNSQSPTQTPTDAKCLK